MRLSETQDVSGNGMLGVDRGETNRVKMTVPLACGVKIVDAVVGVEIQEEAFELGDLTVLGFVDFGEAVYRADARLDC